MILVKENFLPEKAFTGLQKECAETEFKKVKAGDKEFLCMETPSWLYEPLMIERHRIIFTFVRMAKSDFDTDWRIHADNMIAGQKPVLASVLYINDDHGVTPNGTAFWQHFKHGHRLSDDVTEEEFNRLLEEDANQKENFTMTDKIMARPNRLLVYDSRFFHSKYPKAIKEGERIVCATFYVKVD